MGALLSPLTRWLCLEDMVSLSALLGPWQMAIMVFLNGNGGVMLFLMDVILYRGTILME